jgi:hypothetical protein
MNEGFFPNYGYIKTSIGSKYKEGTGYLISANLVLTGANIIYSKSMNKNY